MFKHSYKVRFLALFVVAFICLNTGGAVCVAYCQSLMATTDTAEHCPLKKAAASHCNRNENVESSDERAFVSDEIFCCSVTVGFIPAPVEKSYRFVSVLTTVVVETRSVEMPVVSFTSFVSAFDYRGPPPLDRRVERIKHRLLRI